MLVRICDKGEKYLYLPSSIRDAIKMKNDGFTFRKRARSFKFAFNGIKLLITKEHNAWIHCFAAVCVLIAGMVFGLSRME